MNRNEAISATPIEISVVVVTHGQRLLLVHNRAWGSFSFPMTKLRHWQDPNLACCAHREAWEDAATRAAAEVLGRTLPSPERPLLLTEIRDYQQSDASGLWKLFHFEVFGLALTSIPTLPCGCVAEWLALGELAEREPISRTVRHVLKVLAESDKLPT